MKKKCNICGNDVFFNKTVKKKENNNGLIKCPHCNSLAVLKIKKNGRVKGLKCCFQRTKYEF